MEEAICSSKDKITVYVKNRKDVCTRFERVRRALQLLYRRELKNVEVLEALLSIAEERLKEELRRRVVESY